MDAEGGDGVMFFGGGDEREGEERKGRKGNGRWGGLVGRIFVWSTSASVSTIGGHAVIERGFGTVYQIRGRGSV